MDILGSEKQGLRIALGYVRDGVYTAARWIACDDPKRLAKLEKRCEYIFLNSK